MTPRLSAHPALIAALIAAACASPQAPPAPETARPAPSSIAPVPTPPEATRERDLEPGPEVALEPRLLITDRGALAALEAEGLSFGAWALAAPAANLEQAYEGGFDAVASVLEADLDAIAEADPKSGVGMAFAHRRFDPAWLRSERAWFRLAAVVARLDRAPFAPAYCGEVRLIYRLEYEVEVDGVSVASPLPMTVNVVSWEVPPDAASGCAEVARRWRLPVGATGDALAEHLLSGPLAPERGVRERLKSLEINMQSVRWPSTVRPDMAGHAEYLMRVFTPGGEGYRPAPLENTPDVARLRADRDAWADLLAWLQDPANLPAIDAGTAVLPERFLARSATSVSPRGLTRHANRPFRALFEPEDFAEIALSSYAEIGSPVALLRRLDGLSCVGCHQARSVAGFHVLGEEPSGKVVDALVSAVSPHVEDELVRRRSALLQHIRGEEVDERRPHAERTPNIGGFGEHCGLGDPGLDAWTCAPGLTCVALEDGEVGLCLDAGSTREVGEPCETGRYKRRRDRHRDRIRDASPIACAHDGVCEVNEVGFPGGMCAVSCEALGAHGICGGIPLLTGFNRCIARQIPFAECILENTRPAGLRRCDARHPCRDDYVCARLPDETQGACMPPYFLFQLRVDGHPL